MLQPLDTHTFGLLKLDLRRRFSDNLGRNPHEKTLPNMVSNLIHAIELTLSGRSWLHAFEQNGFGATPKLEMAERIKHQLQWIEDFPHIPLCRPTELQLRMACWPRDLHFNFAAAYLPFPQTHQAAPLPIAPPPTTTVLALPAPVAPVDDDVVDTTSEHSVGGEASQDNEMSATPTQ